MPGPTWASIPVTINQSVNGDQQFDLRAMAGLYGGNYSGAIIDSVDVTLAHQDDDSVGLVLITNGATADVKNSAMDTVRLTPHFGAQLGNDLNTLMLEVSGTAYVQSVTINLRYNDYAYSSYQFGQDLILSQDNIGTIADQTTLDLADVIDLYNYQGYHVISVSVTSQSTLSQFSVLRFFANDIEQDRALTGTTAEPRTFFVSGGNQLGTDLSSLKITAEGSLMIQHVEVRLRPDSVSGVR